MSDDGWTRISSSGPGASAYARMIVGDVEVYVRLTVVEGPEVNEVDRIVVAIETTPGPTEEPPVDVYVGEERVWRGEAGEEL